MIVLPAIDLYHKQAVRLVHGDYNRCTVYSDRPWEVALDFKAAGATHIHLVDLEGAKNGDTPNLDAVRRIVRESGLEAELGGGIRNMETVERCLDAGVRRVILGTAAVTDETFLKQALERFGDKIAVGADVKNGRIAIKGWLETAAVTLEQFLETMQRLGVQNVICTDIAKDGAMGGTNLELYRTLGARYALDITASGGVSTLEDIKALREMGLYGAIVGKAYYTGAIDLKEAIEVAR